MKLIPSSIKEKFKTEAILKQHPEIKFLCREKFQCSLPYVLTTDACFTENS